MYGDLERDETHANCCASGEVTWCEDAQFPADVRYLRADLLYNEARQIAAERAADDEALMAQALESLRAAYGWQATTMQLDKAIAALRARLGA